MGRLEQIAEKIHVLPDFLADRLNYGASGEWEDDIDRAVTESEPFLLKELVARINMDQQIRDIYVDERKQVREFSKHLSRMMILDPGVGSHPWVKRPQADEFPIQLDMASFLPPLATALPAIAESLRHALAAGTLISKDHRAAFEALSSSIHDVVGYLEVLPSQPSAIQGFVLRAQRLEQHGNQDEALDLIYDSIDALLRDGRFEKCDEVLRKIDVSITSVDLVLGVLTATLPVHSRLPSLPRLVSAVREVLLGMNEDADLILAGLEG